MNIYAQKKQFEIATGIGASQLLGDLGGGKGNGSNGLSDFDIESIRPLFNIGIQLPLKFNAGLRMDLNFTQLSGSDRYSENEFRKKRNLSTNTSFVETSFLGYFKLVGADKGFQTINYPYVFTGLSFFYFNPKNNINNTGKSYSLRQYSTEGQGLKDGAKAYSPFSMSVPLGIGYGWEIINQFSFGIEFIAHKSFTDYLDDVSNVYYDNTLLANKKGNTAAELADQHLSSSAPYPAGTKRGNFKKKDNYFYFNFRITKSITKSTKFKKRKIKRY